MSKGHGDEGEKFSSSGKVCADFPEKPDPESAERIPDRRRNRYGFFSPSRF
jgi:hypothetical protein